MTELELPAFKAVRTPRPWPLLLVFRALAGLTFLAALFLVVPRFEVIFKDFGIPLPGTTSALIVASHLAVTFFFLAVPAFVALVAADVLIQQLASTDPMRKSWVSAWNLAMNTLAFGSLAVLAVGLFAPMVSLISKLSG